MTDYISCILWCEDCHDFFQCGPDEHWNAICEKENG